MYFLVCIFFYGFVTRFRITFIGCLFLLERYDIFILLLSYYFTKTWCCHWCCMFYDYKQILNLTKSLILCIYILNIYIYLNWWLNNYLQYLINESFYYWSIIITVFSWMFFNTCNFKSCLYSFRISGFLLHF